MKFLKYILAISIFSISGANSLHACGPYYPDDPNYLRIFRCCTPELSKQWQEGCRFQDYEKEQNCLLWQNITVSSIPLGDIEKVVYSASLSDMKDMPNGTLSDNQFARWLSKPEHSDDLKYLLIAKEIEGLRDYMNDPWYYPYDGDDEHRRLDELTEECKSYTGKRHASRYALQLVRLYFAAKDYQKCIELWENSVSTMPQNIITDMIASYVGGAYLRSGNRDKAIELFTRSQDIGSLISLKAWKGAEEKSIYSDDRVKELEYIFNRFPNSPLLSVKLQKYVRNREDFVCEYDDWAKRDFHDPVPYKINFDGDSMKALAEPVFYAELKRFANKAISSSKSHQKGMWNYALGYLYYLDGDFGKANEYLYKAEKSECTPFLKESIHAFRFLMDANYANNSETYIRKLSKDLKWLDERLTEDVNLTYDKYWQYSNKFNWPLYYWQDVARRVLLGQVCPKLTDSGNKTLALQLANYASNRIYQISPYYKAYHYGYNNKENPETYSSVLTFDEFRKSWPDHNSFDYCSQFFEMINESNADAAAQYAKRIAKPKTELERFLNNRGYVDTDYIYDIVGTLYLREMNYDKASYWLSKVSKDYQARTNIAKDGFFRLDPFKYHFDKKHFISDSTDYKLKFAQEMARLENVMKSDVEQNRKADAKIRFAIGLRNSFGRCWYLTCYEYSSALSTIEDWRDGRAHPSYERDGFKDDNYAQKAYKRVDSLIKEAITEYTNPEHAAQVQLEMMNYATLMLMYPDTKAAAYVRSRCDNYYDYALEKR